jgi:hypothetical protein
MWGGLTCGERNVNCRLQRARRASGPGLLGKARSTDRYRQGGGQNAAERQDAEETLATGIAAIGGDVQGALQGDQGPLLHALAGNVLEIKISAFRAVRKEAKSQCYAPGVEAVVTGVAAPGLQVEEGKGKVYRAATMRAKTINTAALRANHALLSAPLPPRGSIPKTVLPGKTAECLGCSGEGPASFGLHASPL